MTRDSYTPAPLTYGDVLHRPSTVKVGEPIEGKRELNAFLAEKERRSGSVRTVQSYSRMLGISSASSGRPLMRSDRQRRRGAPSKSTRAEPALWPRSLRG